MRIAASDAERKAETAMTRTMMKNSVSMTNATKKGSLKVLEKAEETAQKGECWGE